MTATGVGMACERTLSSTPLPSAPLAWLPQQYAAPSSVSAQVLEVSAAAMAPNDSPPITATGVSASFLVPSPSAPSGLPPQHHAAPSRVSAQVWSPLVLICAKTRALDT